MIFLPNRLASSFCLGMVLLFLNPSSCRDARDEIRRSLKGADVNGYFLATKEEDSQTIITLTNGAIRAPIKFDSANNLVLGYARVRDKQTKATKTLKAALVKSDNAFRLHVTDIATNEQVVNEIFVPRACPSGGPVFNNLTECTDDFSCKSLPQLQAEANRTCKAQYFHLECCFGDGTAVHVLYFITPTDRKCQTAFPFDIDTLEVIRE
jgi:hypothetical protein